MSGTRLIIRESPFTRSVDRRVLRFVRERGVLPPGERVLVAVSGGPDSSAMLIVLARLAESLGLSLHAAHFDHRLRREEEAAADREFVETLCRALSLECVSGREHVAARARRRKESVEEAARNLRYQFLGAQAKKFGASVVAVGHTLDDRAETVLLHILRGSGIDGLAAMPPRAPWPFGRGPEIARPLISLQRQDTERYCREAGIEARQDATNDLPIATRNRVRHELLPAMREFNPRIAEGLNRLAEAAARDADFVRRLAGEEWSRLARVGREEVTMDRDSLATLHPAIAVRLIRRAAEAVGGRLEIEADQAEAVLAALQKERQRVPLAGGLEAVVRRGQLVTRKVGEPARPAVADTAFRVPGETSAGGWTFCAELLAGGQLPEHIGPMEAYLDAGALAGALRVRSRRDGDRFRPLGLGGTKKLQDLFVDAGVPAEERDRVPVVVDDTGIVWVAGLRIAERAAVRSGTRRMLRLEARRAAPGEHVNPRGRRQRK